MIFDISFSHCKFLRSKPTQLSENRPKALIKPPFPHPISRICLFSSSILFFEKMEYSNVLQEIFDIRSNTLSSY